MPVPPESNSFLFLMFLHSLNDFANDPRFVNLLSRLDSWADENIFYYERDEVIANLVTWFNDNPEASDEEIYDDCVNCAYACE